ncbi:AAA family ATPase [Pseudomonas sp. 5Ae-yellow]|uniref:AAA family ATPase n=1 Tax=Pseudomonas sp. 5Ae-yellow TaxID=2759848 RepID=UPI0015F63152|nr:AAA family ATPase [Pseudomonas sp. 5Ae-yellow]MBA6419610.1 AAA family ATPase [Pseudomonas sp. 5Ae-yellow]
MRVVIQNCNNIDYGEIEIKEKTLNIKYAINGTGKSTIAKAIVASVNDAKKNSNELAKLKPYKLKEDKDSESSVRGCEGIRDVLVFDEAYINNVAFRADELVEGSFDIFIRGEEYERGIQQIEALTSQMKNTLNGDEEISGLLSDFDEIIAAFGKEVKQGIHASSAMSQAFKGGNNVDNIPEGLEPFKSFIQHSDNYKWVSWQHKGSPFMDIGNECPYCATDTTGKKEIINKVSEVYKPKVIESLNKIVMNFKRLEEYFSEETRKRISGFVSKIEGYTDDESGYLLEIKAQIERLKERFDTARSLGFSSLKDVDKVLDAIDNQIIDLDNFPHLKSDATQVKADIVNNELKELREVAGRLQAEVFKQKKVITSLVEEHGKKINDFLINAGYSYHVFLQEEPSGEYRLKLEPNDVRGEVTEVKSRLSFGERNAFALVLFMFHALKRKADLIVLDDPISSFDKNKKYAVMEMLFSKGNSSLSGKTVLMLTHDFEPIVDLVHHHRDRFESLNSWFLENNQGQLIEKIITNKDIKTFVEINTSNLADDINPLHKVIYLRRYFEVLNRKGFAFDVLSSVLHKRKHPQLNDKRTTEKGLTELFLRNLTDEEFSSGVSAIIEHINDFDYDGLYALTSDNVRMKELYLNTAVAGAECNTVIELTQEHHIA